MICSTLLVSSMHVLFDVTTGQQTKRMRRESNYCQEGVLLS